MGTNYEINKIRMGRNGTWDNWEYQVLVNEDQARRLNIPFASRRELNSSKDLDSLAEKLSRLPDIRYATLVTTSGLLDNQRGVSLAESYWADVLTQYGHMSEEELSTLGALVQRYAMKNEERK